MKIEISVDDKVVNIPRILILFLSAIIFGYYLKLNSVTPYWNDEFYYSFVSGGDTRIQNLYDIIRSQHYLYFNWTGRIVIHGLVQLFLLLGKGYFNIFNSLFLVSLIYLICSFIKIRKFNNKEDLRDFVIVTLLLWFFMPVMGQTAFWLAGSINYLWSTVFVMLFLLPYRYLLEGSHIIGNRIASIVLMFFLGLLAGWSQENAAVTAVVFVGITFLFMMYKHKKIPYWFTSGSIGLIIGALFLLLAPGNGVRKEKMYFDLSLKDQIFGFIQSIKNIVLHEQLALFVLFFVMFICMFFVNSESKVKNIGLSLMLFITGFISYLAMIASPEFPTRATFVGAIFIIIAITILSKFLNRKLRLTIVIISLIPFLLSVNSLFKDLQIVGRENVIREKIIKESLESGKYDVRLPTFSVKGSDRVFIFDITMNPEYTSNVHFAKYYGLNSVVIDTPVLVVELKDPVINQYQLYYDTGNGFNETESSLSGIYNQTDGKKLYFKLPNKPIYNFRFDPGIHANEKIVISKITIQNKNILKKYESTDLLEMLVPKHDIYSVINKDGYLEVVTSGNDPQFEFVNDYTDKGIGITIDFASKLSEQIQIFYDSGKGFIEKNSVKVNMNDDDKLIVRLPSAYINNLRIDLGNKKDLFIGIKSISIEGAKTIKINDLFKETSSLNQLEKSGLRDGAQYFLTKGNDPSFQINNLEIMSAGE
ncbi:DUF3329 domain-containing protein [Paenibacillus sp. FSL H3-0333]|uniref:DUF3329 domain-containing protein n=1 Tax=Paenibacillus sp. FSL H3-0333 TaxID=2921373 RepID=UPI0030FB143E